MNPRTLAGILLCSIASLPAVGQIPPPDTGGVRIGQREVPASDEEAERRLRELLPFWASSAARYERYALRFVCTETHRTIDYSYGEGQAKKEKEVPYGYLLTLDPKTATYEVVRQSLDKEGHPTGNEKTLDMRCPEPYSWSFLFLPTTVSTLHLRYLGREIQNYRLTHVVSFEGSAARDKGRDLREWSGTIWIEDRTGNVVRVEARPNYQKDRMLALWREFQQSMMVLPGLKAKPRPHGYVLAVLFDFERDGLLFPSRLDLTDFTWLATEREAVDTRLVLTYDDYRFFKTAADETIENPTGG